MEGRDPRVGGGSASPQQPGRHDRKLARRHSPPTDTFLAYVVVLTCPRSVAFVPHAFAGSPDICRPLSPTRPNTKTSLTQSNLAALNNLTT